MTPHEKELHKQEKLFHLGMQLYQQGCDCPESNTSEYFGWMAAQEMKEVKSRYLQQARKLADLILDYTYLGKTLELPKLNGFSEQQIEWANEIRNGLLERVKLALAYQESSNKRNEIELWLAQNIFCKNDAQWWVENRHINLIHLAEMSIKREHRPI